MADVREQILERLRDLAKVRGAGTIYRNQVQFSDGDALPAICLFDGDEDTKDQPHGRPSNSIVIVEMRPYFQITLQGDAAQVGEDINRLRLRLIAKVMEDSTLAALTLDNRGVRYLGCMTQSKAGRNLQLDMALRFTIMYALRPSDLADL